MLYAEMLKKNESPIIGMRFSQQNYVNKLLECQDNALKRK